MSKVKNKFLVLIMIFGIILSAFFFSACNKKDENKIYINEKVYDKNWKDKVNVIAKINNNQSIVNIYKDVYDAILYSINYTNVYIETQNCYYYDLYDESAETITKSNDVKILTGEAIYEEIEIDDEKAKYWYVPNFENVGVVKGEDCYASYFEYYLKSESDTDNYYKKEISQPWNSLDGNGFVSEQIQLFAPNFDLETIEELKATLSLVYYNNDYCEITLEFTEIDEELNGFINNKYTFSIDDENYLFKSELNMDFYAMNEDNKLDNAMLLQTINTTSNIRYNHADMPKLEIEKWQK